MCSGAKNAASRNQAGLVKSPARFLARCATGKPASISTFKVNYNQQAAVGEIYKQGCHLKGLTFLGIDNGVHLVR